MPASPSASSDGAELHIQQRAAGAQVVHLGGRAEDRRRPVAVGALHRRDALGQRLAGAPPVGRRTRDRAEVDVAGGRQHLDAVTPAARAGTAVHAREEAVEDAPHDGRRRGRRRCRTWAPVDEASPQRRPGRRNPASSARHQVGEAEAPSSKTGSDRCQAVGDRADPDALDVGVVVAGAAGVVIAAVADAVVGQHREERGRHEPRVHLARSARCPRSSRR